MTVLRDYVAGLTQPTLGAGGPPYDEVIGPDGSLRSSWKRLAEIAVGLTARELARVDDEITRALADDGVTYARPGRTPAPWRLDPVPLLVDPEEWRPLEIGLAQRAELLNAVLADLYGDRTLLRDGVLPPAVVYAHGGFFRSMARVSGSEPQPLMLAATDLGRDEDGDWRVLGDRTQAPSGLGFALENRKVLSRVLPDLYRDADCHRMAPYLQALRSALLGAAPGDPAAPRVVVLTPGTQSETAYDQAALATHLGFPLVQGSDLSVRDGYVVMRTHRAAERVDVILRRVDAAWCDPLELRGESELGVAGLSEVVRRGRVRVVNGLGSGVLESPALVPYLPAVCEHLLGESLRLPSLDTWWLGDPAARDDVLHRLDTLAVRTVDDPRPVTGTGTELRERVLAAPYRYVAQRRVSLSQAPVWRDDRPQPRQITLRTFTLRHGSAYRPLLGGLASIHDGSAGRSLASKDVWVLKADPLEADQGIDEVLSVTNTRAMPATVPRVLEDMFWVGRYAERAEDTLRLALAAYVLASDFRSRPRSAGGVSLDAVRGVLRSLAGPAPDDVSEDVSEDLRSLLLDADRPGSVAQSLRALRDALAGVRDQFSPDVWQVFATTGRAAAALRGSPHSHQVAESAGRMLTGVLALQGVTASMVRDPGWHMIGAGRALERSVQVCTLLRATVERRGLEVDRQVLGAALAAAESAVTHRRRYRDYVRLDGVLDLVLLDADNPRSVLFSLHRLRDDLAALPASTGSTRPERLLADLIEEVEAVETATLVAIGGAHRPHLAAFLDSVGAQLPRLADAIAALHFASGPRPRRLGSLPVLEAL